VQVRIIAQMDHFDDDKYHTFNYDFDEHLSE